MLEWAIRKALKGGLPTTELPKMIDANFRFDGYLKDGYGLIQGTNISIQGKDANDTFANFFVLAKRLQIPFSVSWVWGEDGQLPNQAGMMEWKS